MPSSVVAHHAAVAPAPGARLRGSSLLTDDADLEARERRERGRPPAAAEIAAILAGHVLERCRTGCGSSIRCTMSKSWRTPVTNDVAVEPLADAVELRPDRRGSTVAMPSHLARPLTLLSLDLNHCASAQACASSSEIAAWRSS